MPEVSDSPVSSFTFTDPDELEAIYRGRQDFHAMPLDLQPLWCQVYNLKLKGADFSFREIRNPLRVWGDKSSNRFVFEFLMRPPAGEMLSHGVAIQPGVLYGFDAQRGIDMVMPPQSMLGSLSIERPLFEECLHIMGRSDLDAHFWANNYVHSPNGFASAQRYLKELYNLVRGQAGFLQQPQISRLILDDYVPLLIEAIPPMGKKWPRAPECRPRVDLVRQAEAHMRANLEHPMTLKDLCAVLNTSSSPLSRGFQEVFGVSPMVYLRELRLYAVHQTLKAADPTTTQITAVAQQFGFWHGGRFSQYYQQMFGQPPSATLRQR